MYLKKSERNKFEGENEDNTQENKFLSKLPTFIPLVVVYSITVMVILAIHSTLCTNAL